MAWGSNPFTSYSTMPYGQSNTWAGGQGNPWGQQNGAFNQNALSFGNQGGFGGMPSMSTPYQVNQPNVQQQQPGQQMPGAYLPPRDTFNAPMFTNGPQSGGMSGMYGGGMPPWMQQMPPWMQGGGGMPPWMQGYGGMGPMNFGQQPQQPMPGNNAVRGSIPGNAFSNPANQGSLKPMALSNPAYTPQNNYGRPTQLQTTPLGGVPAAGQTAFSQQELQSGQFAAPTTDSRVPSVVAGMLGMGGQAPDPNMFWNQTQNRWEY